jgi:hypothetical protein
MPASNKVDSNLVGLSFAEESSLKVITGGGVWFGLEPNSFADFGGDFKSVARQPIKADRQNQKGTIVDLDASGGFNLDFTRTNCLRLLQGFFFADARQPVSTAPLNGAAVAITSVASADNSFNAAAGLGIFAASQLALASGFTGAANNGLHKIATVAAGKITVAEALVVEAAPPAAAKLELVGNEFAAADVNFAVTSGIPSLTSTVYDFTTNPNLIPGAWVFIGGDLAANKFANNVGYARIAVGGVVAHSLVFDETTWTPVTESGAGKSIRMFYGTTIRNEQNPALIKRRSYQFERTLGSGANGTQGEYIIGAVANELTINVPKNDKLMADLAFIACDHVTVSGDPGDTLKSLAGTVVPAQGEDAINTASNVYRIKLAVKDPTTSNPTALFGYVDEAKITIKNGVKPIKAVGVLGNFDTSSGNFEMGGSITAFFSTVAAIRAVRNNADCGFNAICASKNSGFVFDIPLLALGGGRAKVEKDAPIQIPLDANGAQSTFGYTGQYSYFPYLPTVAMPV